MKLPPYGKPIYERIKHLNLPLFVVVCVGMDSWDRAKKWNAGPNNTPAMVLPPGESPDAFKWPVQGCHVILEYDTGPTPETLQALMQTLLYSHASMVSTRPLQTDVTKDLYGYRLDTGGRVDVQEVPITIMGCAYG